MTIPSPETDDGGSGDGKSNGSLKLVWVIVIGFSLNIVTSAITQRRAQGKHEEILGKIEEIRQDIKGIGAAPARHKH